MPDMAVGHSIINVQDHHTNISVAPAHPTAGEIKDTKLTQKNMFKVAVLSITVSAVAIVSDFSDVVHANPYYEFLLKAYAVVVLATFIFGMGLLLLPVLLPRVPISAAVAKKIVWVTVALVHIAIALKISLFVVS